MAMMITSSGERRTANYKPNIWQHNLLHSLPNQYDADEKYKKEAEKLIEQVKQTMFREHVDDDNDEDESSLIAQAELISSITNLGLSYHFETEIRQALSRIATRSSEMMVEGSSTSSVADFDHHLYATTLCFRLLRQHGYHVSQDIFRGFVDSNNKFISRSSDYSVKALGELFEASNLGLVDEHILEEARLFSSQGLIKSLTRHDDDDEVARRDSNDTIGVPLHWRLEWYNVRRQINAYEKQEKNDESAIKSCSSLLLDLAKLNFNNVQFAHQQDLKEVTLRWWKDLGVRDKLSFARDRMVESFLLATGIAPEREYGSLRKWLAKTIQLILIVDDVYDIYGSLAELEKFTNAIERWNFKEVQQLPECMVTCFQILDNTTKEIAVQIQKERCWGHGCLVLTSLQKAWADFCKALLTEARWYSKGQTPSLEEYLSNGWISSSGPLLAAHILFGLTGEEEINNNMFEASREIVYWASLIVRLCNDEGTSAAELARGDAPSSILCYMREANECEEVAREHIRSLIINAWMNINNHLSTLSQAQQRLIKYVVNVGRIGHFMYQHGDGFGVQDRETKQEVLFNLIQPITIPHH